ncbi:hypothetical protein GEMRC1_010358 [Eukaryota sp. GEM-RC1]
MADPVNPELSLLQQQTQGLHLKYFEQKEEIERLKIALNRETKTRITHDEYLGAIRLSWEQLMLSLSSILAETGIGDPLDALQHLPVRPPHDYIDFFQRLMTFSFPEDSASIPNQYKESLSPTFHLISELSAAVRTLIAQRDSAASIPPEQIDRTSSLETVIAQLKSRLTEYETSAAVQEDQTAQFKQLLGQKDAVILEKNMFLEELGRRLSKCSDQTHHQSDTISSLQSQLEHLQHEYSSLQLKEADLRRKFDTFSTFSESGVGGPSPEMLDELHDTKTKLRSRTQTIEKLQQENKSLRDQLSNVKGSVQLDDDTVRKSVLYNSSYAKFSKAIKDRKSLQQRNTLLEHEIDNLKTKFKEQLQQRDKLPQQRIYDIRKQVNDLFLENTKLKKEIDGLKSGGDGVGGCKCNEIQKEQQELIESLRTSLEKEKAKSSGQKKSEDEELNELMMELDDVASQLSRAEEQNSRLLMQLRDKEEVNTSLLKTRHDLKTEMASLKRAVLLAKQENDLLKAEGLCMQEMVTNFQVTREKEEEERKKLMESLDLLQKSSKTLSSTQEKDSW